MVVNAVAVTDTLVGLSGYAVVDTVMVAASDTPELFVAVIETVYVFPGERPTIVTGES
jgi:hypothetical protein